VAVSLAAAVLAAASVVPAAFADGPMNSQSNEMSDYTGPIMTVLPGQEATHLRKLQQLADASAAQQAAQAAAESGAMTTAAVDPERLVPTYERQQANYYCGPAAIQDMSDYVWGKGSTGVKYSQAYISNKWTNTTTAGTGITAETTGANGVLVGSPRAVWPYELTRPTDPQNWSNLLFVDTDDGMPQIMNVTPWWQSASGTWYHLASWAAHKSTGGHWIVGNGWQGYWDGTSGPNVRYDDGSGGYGGSTGTYWENQYTMWLLIYHHNNAVIW
jgi:hypothetical protein